MVSAGVAGNLTNDLNDERAGLFFRFWIRVNGRAKIWKWAVCTAEGQLVMKGVEGARPAAVYQANRALFLLLSSAPYRQPT
jgi:hypothetical protein